jgi:lipopolysaccharide export LptBFGC system permease protein LptF
MKMATVASIKVGFPAYIAVWIPNMIFAFVALFMYRFAQK